MCSRPRLCCSLSPQVFWESKYPSYECAGNFGVPAVTNDPAKLKELQTIELKHGRCARPPQPLPPPTIRATAAAARAEHASAATSCTLAYLGGSLLPAVAMIGIISFACAVSIPGSVPFYPF